MTQIEVLSSPERRRRWSAEQKRSIVAEAFVPGASVCEVARRMDVVPSLIHRWRQELRTAAEEFAEVVVAPAPDERTAAGRPAMDEHLLVSGCGLRHVDGQQVILAVDCNTVAGEMNKGQVSRLPHAASA
jgi:transposase